MKKTVATFTALSAIGLLLLSGCTTTTPTTTSEPSHTPTSTPTPPPLTLTLKQIGTVKSHEGFQLLMGADDVYSLAVVSDGKVTQEFILPPGGETFQVESGIPVTVNQPLFSTASVGDYIKVTILAYDKDPDFEEWFSIVAPVASALVAPQLALPSLGGVDILTVALQTGAVESAVGGGDEFIGSYEAVWRKDLGWGAGEYIAVGTQDLQLWFDIDVPGGPRRIVRSQATTVPSLPTATAIPSPTHSPTATPTPATPLILPTPTATAIRAGQPVLTLRTISARILDDHEPFGSGDVYAIAAIGVGQEVFWTSAPGNGENIQVNDGDVAALSASVEAIVKSETTQIYIGIWEEDHDNCFFDLEAKLGDIFQGTLSGFASLVGSSLSSCGDDLVGEGIQTLLAEENWLLGRHETALGDAVVIFEIEFSEGI